ncbi:EAL domain-containing response regulator [Pseudoxanthomonas sangjuensis]|uniref:EAL domain-containing protein n=1 Tax=Pseudoxanthomonas sangjuensis TaxID=1503750 RepID=UPI001FE419A6|nr:EAL domain-containing protein [Pseudoxanthomonas sangjuensis]
MPANESTSRSQDESSRSRLRAETPPARFWRRWTDQDAPPARIETAYAEYPAASVDTAPLTMPVAVPAPQPDFDSAYAAIAADLAAIDSTAIEPVLAGAVERATIAATLAPAAPDSPIIVDLSSKPAAAPVAAMPAAPATAEALPKTAAKRPAARAPKGGGDADGSAGGDAGSPPAASGDGSGDAQSPYRVLIVEDDRGQALFAQSVLHGAGMQAEVQMQSEGVLDAIRKFQPDLILMDLHMPGRDGMDLTQLIRQQPEYLHLPIVFLTGDPDPERQYEVLESGADDFLTKPIRPRHLIAAVSNRILRARLRAPVVAEAAAQSLNPETGLPTRTFVLQQLAATIKRQDVAGLFFIEIGSASSLRERYGYANFEQLMSQAGRRLAQAAQPHLLARLSDNNFLALASGIAPDALQAFAHGLRDGLTQQAFMLRDGETLRLRGVVGYAALPQGFVDSGSALEATERAALLARQQTGDVAAYAPPAPVEDAMTTTLAQATPELAFQPIVSVAGSEAAQYQVLLRLRQSDGSLVSAAQAVPAAELAGRIVEFDRRVVTLVLDLLAKNQAEGVSLRLFVSQSPRSLARDDSADWLLQAIAARGVEPSSLVIDLRLADALIHTVTLRQFCQRLMAAGVQFCLSQYEPGHDAEALLSQLPLGYLRVSNRYATAHNDPVLRDQLRGIIDLAHRHGLQVIGQQVEDPQAAAAMWLGGVDFIQGNLVQGVGSDLGFDFHNAVL